MAIGMLLLLDDMDVRVSILPEACCDAPESCAIERGIDDGEILVAIVVLQERLVGYGIDEKMILNFDFSCDFL